MLTAVIVPNYWLQFRAIALPAGILEKNVFCIINFLSFFVKTIRGDGFAHSVQIFAKISVTQYRLCNTIIHLSKFPKNSWPYVRDKSSRPPSSIVIVPSSLAFCNGVFLAVTVYVISRRLRLINLYPICCQQIHGCCTCTSTAGAETIRYADAKRNAAISCIDTCKFSRFLTSSL